MFASLVTYAVDGVDLMVNGEDRAQVWDFVAGRSGGQVRSRVFHADTWRRRATQRFPTVWPQNCPADEDRVKTMLRRAGSRCK